VTHLSSTLLLIVIFIIIAQDLGERHLQQRMPSQSCKGP